MLWAEAERWFRLLWRFRSYLVLLSKQSKSTRRKRSLVDSGCSKESIEHDYAKSQELGTNCYTTADISADLVREDYTFNIGDGEIYEGFHNVPLQPGASYHVYPAVKVDLPVRFMLIRQDWVLAFHFIYHLKELR